MEKNFNWVECFDPTQQHCRLLPNCGLKRLLARAGDAYLQVLDEATLADALSGTAPITLPKVAPISLPDKEMFNNLK